MNDMKSVIKMGVSQRKDTSRRDEMDFEDVVTDSSSVMSSVLDSISSIFTLRTATP